MSGEADSPGWHSRSAVTTHEELILTCGGLVVALSPVGGQRVGDWIGVLVKQIVAEFVEDNIAPAGLAEEDGRVPASVPARDDQLILDDREAAAAPHFAAAAHERTGISLTACLQPYIEQLSWEGSRRRSRAYAAAAAASAQCTV
eukprot:SAG11_NODE_8666_length_989_cov_1.396629_3_plen_144_part_01